MDLSVSCLVGKVKERRFTTFTKEGSTEYQLRISMTFFQNWENFFMDSLKSETVVMWIFATQIAVLGPISIGASWTGGISGLIPNY